MSTRRQHFVPRVYMKAWETLVERRLESNKKFQGVYVFDKGVYIGDGHNKDSVLWKPHLYTISFEQLYITKVCPKVLTYFVNQIYELMKKNSPKPIYGEFGYHKIKTKESIRKHLYDIDNWEFNYCENSKPARTQSIIGSIKKMNCYILEQAFSDNYENHWEGIFKRFIKEVHEGMPISIERSERRIPKDASIDMLEFFL